jgi:hypothetical protein
LLFVEAPEDVGQMRKRDNLRVWLAGKTVATAQLTPLLFHGRDESLQSPRHAHVSRRRWRMSAATSHFRSASTAASNWPTFQSTRSLWAPKLSRCSRTGKKRAGCRPSLIGCGQARRCSAPMDRASPCHPLGGGLARVSFPSALRHVARWAQNPAKSSSFRSEKRTRLNRNCRKSHLTTTASNFERIARSQKHK